MQFFYDIRNVNVLPQDHVHHATEHNAHFRIDHMALVFQKTLCLMILHCHQNEIRNFCIDLIDQCFFCYAGIHRIYTDNVQIFISTL